MPKLSALQQEATLRSHGIEASNITVDGRKMRSGRPETWVWQLRKLRDGDTLAVSHMRAIYVPLPGLTVRKALLKPLHQVEDKGATLVELSTGRWSNAKRECEIMIAEALDQIARASKGGRKAHEFSAEELALVEENWRSFRHRTNQQAVDAILAEARDRGMVNLLRLRSVQAFVNVFKGSGRERIKRD